MINLIQLSSRCVLMLSFTLVSLFSQGQNWTWAKSLGSGHVMATLESDHQGFIYTAFGFSSPSYSNISLCWTNPLFIKYDTTGNIVWAQGTASGGASVLDFAFDLQNNVYVCGMIASNCTFCGGSQNNISVPAGMLPKSFVGKYNSSGDLQWITYWSDSAVYDNYHITVDAAANTYVQTFGYTQNNTFSGLKKLDPSGTIIWQQHYNANQGTFVDFSQIEADSSGNLYIAGGFRDSVQLGTKSLKANQPQCGICTTAFLAKMDSSGNCLWLEKMGGTLTFIQDMKLDRSGHLYIGGYCQNGCSAGSTTLSAQGFIAKFDTSGNALWAKTQMPRVKRLVVDSQDHPLAYGTFTLGKSVFGTPPDTLSLNNVRWVGEIFVIKYNTIGQPLWAVSPTTITTDGYNYAEEFTIDPYDNIYMSGEFVGASFFGSIVVSSTVQGSFYEIYFAKMNNSGPGSVGLHEEKDATPVRVYPNPASASINVSLDHPGSAGCRIRVSDILGKIHLDRTFHENAVSLDISELSSGIYILETEYGHVVKRLKVVKE